MFEKNKPRYLTRGVNNVLSLALQCFLWNCIDQMPKDCDYLQIFELSRTSEGFQKIIHKQEQPEYQTEYIITEELFSEAIETKIYVIDDSEYCTMLLAEEY